ncbi:tripartite tricarboxylate transporter permease [Aquabacter sp. CN5-332]|uniref:tripartite tricarboxylate transporter permease n=1 Tax=Aquabacter sp. CN5-332 TaxID=3156608 RepID=UPI0032B54832
MDLLANLALGFSTALSPENLLFCFVGCLLGTLVGVLPGIGPTATIAMLLPLTFSFEPVTALIMLAGIYYGAQYGGSTTAILVNVPGETSSAVTALDGYAMTLKGRGGQALAVAAIGSFIAGCIGTLILGLFAPPLAAVALNFGPPEYFSLIVLGLISSTALARGSLLNALCMIVTGLLLGLVGLDMYTAARRFTLGQLELYNGISFVALSIGLFGISEILRNLESKTESEVKVREIKGFMLSKEDMKRSIAPILRGTALGSALGILPGGGHILASFASYTFEKKISKTPKRFGAGAIEGVAGPESANNAAAQTSFIPLLTLGIPAHPIMALILGALIIQGIAPGPKVIETEPALFWGIVASMWIGNLMLVVLNLPLVGMWMKLLKIPYSIMFPSIIAFSVIGTYSIDMNAFHVYEMAIFGALGYLFMKLWCEPAPLLLGFVLGPMLEEHFRRAMILSRGDPTIFFSRPISAVLLVIAVSIMVFAILPSIRRKREEIFVEDAD